MEEGNAEPEVEAKNSSSSQAAGDSGKTTQTKSPSNRPLIIGALIVIGFAIALAVGLALYYTGEDDDNDVSSVASALAPRAGAIIDCLPSYRREEELMADKEDECLARSCVWEPQADAGAPWCIFPAHHGYKIVGDVKNTARGHHLDLQHIDSPWMLEMGGEIFPQVVVDVDRQTPNRVRIKIHPKDHTRYEVPTDALDVEMTSDQTVVPESSALYHVTFVSEPFGVAVTRKDTGAVVFNTSLPGTILADQFLQISTRLANERIFGFGEHRHLSFKHDMNWKRWSMFTRDTGPNNDWNLYGHHPVYMNLEDDGKANMVLLKNSNAMEVVLQPSPEPAITYKTIGGVLDFYIFLGDSPQDVVQHYQKAIGLPLMPPYWSLGYHLCRWGYTDIEDMRSVIQRNRDAGIPYDGQWGDFDTFIKAFVFTSDPINWAGFPDLVQDLIDHGQHFITIVDPGVGVNETVTQEVKAVYPDYDMLASGEAAGVMVMAADNTTLHGEVWPGVTAFPDFTNPDSQDWWTQWIEFYINEVGVKVDALWIDMNEPASFVPGSVEGCADNRWNYPPYVPDVDGSREEGALFVKTLCMDATQYWGKHYDVHSLYAHSMAQRTFRALEAVYKERRPWVMTRSSYPGTGHFATKWQGDNRAAWEDMHYSIISLMEFGMFGFPMNGADICGFWEEPSYELCVRWHQLGAFYPFSRNHNGRGEEDARFKDQDPASFGPEFVDLIKPALMTRYKLLPYLYTLLYTAHTEGASVFQPLLFEFPNDEESIGVDTQFMLGPAFLVSPVLQEGATTVEAYFPEGRWFDYMTGEMVEQGTATLDTPIDKFNLHIRAGHVIPWQEPEVTTAASRNNSLGLLVALGQNGIANGHLYWDDGQSVVSPDTSNIIKFIMSQAGELRIVPEVSNLSTHLKFDTLEVYGLERLPAWVKVNGNDIDGSQKTLVNNNIFRWSGLGLPMLDNSTISWAVY